MPLIYRKQGNVARFTIDNPPVNAFNPEMHKTFRDALVDFAADRNVHVGILDAAGDRIFCAGDDIKTPRPTRSVGETIERHMFPNREDDAPEYPGWESEVMSMPRYKPIIGAVNGPCLGQGMVYLLMLTDIRIATPAARFGFPEIGYGMGGAGGITRLGRQIAHTTAMWMLLTGEAVDAETALRQNLINEVVAFEDLTSRADAIAAKIAGHPPLAVRVEMEAYQKGLDLNRADAVSYAGHLYRLQRAAMDPTPPLAKTRTKHD